MPWHIGTSDTCPSSKPHAVIKDDDGTVEGCHATKSDAEAQMAALYASEDKAQSYKPTSGMVSAAKRGLEMRREHGRGGTEVGVARARDISNGKQLSLSTIKRMHSFFSRHEGNKKAEGFNSGEDGYPSAGRIAWLLWGGDAGQSWARRIVERQEKSMSEEQEQQEKMGDMVGYASMATSFADLDAEQEAAEQAYNVRQTANQFQALVSNIMVSDEIEDKGTAVQSLAAEFSDRIGQAMQKELAEKAKTEKVEESPPSNKSLVGKVIDAVKSAFTPEPEPQDSSLMLWKDTDTGQYKWLARYTNNLRDRDNPPEILTAQAHRRFVEMVDNKEAPLPELWLWHTPGSRWGKAQYVAYDDRGDVGFTIAGGTVDKGKEALAEALAALPTTSLRVSHGMPITSIKRDPSDSSLITEYKTREISPLPSEWAANTYTGFSILKEGTPMSIPDEKRQALVDLGLSEDVLSLVEQHNEQEAEQAKEAGLESKELEPDATDATDATKAETETEETPVEDAPLTREEVAGAINASTGSLVQAVEALIGKVDELTKQVDALKQSDEQKIAEKAADTPAASLMDLLKFRAVGSAEAQEDGRSALSKSGPAEKEAPVPSITGIPFVDALATGRDIQIAAE